MKCNHVCHSFRCKLLTSGILKNDEHDKTEIFVESGAKHHNPKNEQNKP